MHNEFDFEIKKEDVFQHIFTNNKQEEWIKTKGLYQQITKNKIENFEPTFFDIKDLLNETKLGEILHLIKEGRKYKKIVVVKFSEDESFNECWKKLDDGIKKTIGFNTVIIKK